MAESVDKKVERAKKTVSELEKVRDEQIELLKKQGVKEEVINKFLGVGKPA